MKNVSAYELLGATVIEPKEPESKVVKMGKGLIKSKTAWVNILTAVVGVITYLNGTELLAANPQLVAIGVTVLGVLNVVLRLVTKTAITSIK